MLIVSNTHKVVFILQTGSSASLFNIITPSRLMTIFIIQILLPSVGSCRRLSPEPKSADSQVPQSAFHICGFRICEFTQLKCYPVFTVRSWLNLPVQNPQILKAKCNILSLLNKTYTLSKAKESQPNGC